MLFTQPTTFCPARDTEPLSAFRSLATASNIASSLIVLHVEVRLLPTAACKDRETISTPTSPLSVILDPSVYTSRTDSRAGRLTSPDSSETSEDSPSSLISELPSESAGGLLESCVPHHSSEEPLAGVQDPLNPKSGMDCFTLSFRSIWHHLRPW